MRRALLLAALALGCSLAGSAAASDRVGLNATHVALAVSADGKTAVVSYRSGHTVRHVLVWGAVDALPPSQTVPQVRFQLDFTGGWQTHRNAHWW
jgi:hypothetical protein